MYFVFKPSATVTSWWQNNYHDRSNGRGWATLHALCSQKRITCSQGVNLHSQEPHSRQELIGLNLGGILTLGT